FRSWPALKAEVEFNRSIDLGAKPPLPAGVSPDLLEWPEERWSFGGAAAIETAGGVLFPELLAVGPGHAVLNASLVPHLLPPAQEAAWVELRGHGGPPGRLVSSPRPAVHLSQVTPVSAAASDLEDLARSLIGARLAGSSVGLRDRSMALARVAAIRESGELD